MSSALGATGPRVIGTYDSNLPGPTVIAFAAVHGNEPAGILAARRVLDRLAQLRPYWRGRFVALVGNPPAVAARKRYLDVDLNRIWTEEGEAHCGADMSREPSEFRQRRELLSIIEAETADPSRELIVLDLHSTSGDGAPFVCISDTIRSREIAIATHLPLVLGIEETIAGSLLDFMEAHGRVALGIEGGQHDAETTVGNLESAIWLALTAAGCIDSRELPELSEYRRRLEIASGGAPPVTEVVGIHRVKDEDEFRMLPGFRNFSPVRKGQLVARDRRGPIRADREALVLMPLYQGTGDHGFFLVRAVHRFWLDVSAWMRRARFGKALEHLPGVRRDVRTGRVRVSRFAARVVVGLFHLAGYKRCPDEDGRLVFERRLDRPLVE